MSAPDRFRQSTRQATHDTLEGDRRRLRGAATVARPVAATIALVAMAAAPSGAQSQALEDDPFAGVEEMVVVGGSAASLLAETQTSAISFDASDLDNYRVQDVGDVAAYVPNLEIRTANATNASFFIRGVGLQDFGSNASSSVPIFQDGVARNPSATQLVGLFDIGGLTVMKGPQGSGNYRNASAGAFVIKTQQPEPEFSGYAKVSYSKIYSVDARDANRYDMEAAMNAPVYGDIVSMRLSTRYQRETPWFENGCANRTDFEDRPIFTNRQNFPAAQICGESFQRAPGGDPALAEPGRGISEVTPFLSRYLGEIDDFGFRGQVRIQPPDGGIDVVARLEVSRLNRDSTLGQVFGTGIITNPIGGEDSTGYRDPDILSRVNEYIPYVRALAAPMFLNNIEAESRALVFVAKELYKDPLDQHPYRGDFDQPGRLILETWAASVTSKFEFDESLLEVNAGYVDYRKSEARDTDLSPNVVFPSRTNDQAWEVYGAAELSGDTLRDYPVSWKTGIFNMWQKVEAFQLQTVFEDEAFNDFEEQLWSWGVFAEIEYEFLEGFTLGGGGRYNWERKDFRVQENTVTGVFGDGSGNPNVGVEIQRGSENQRTWEQWTGFAKIAYSFTEDIEAWIKYTRGFKAGHFNPSRAQAAKDPARGFADPEQIDAAELGTNFAFWEGRISGNAALFFYNYRNYQVFRLTRTTTVFRTIESARLARNYGADFEIVLSPLEGFVPEMIEGLRITINGGWLETSYVEFSTLETRQTGDAQIGVPINYSGNPLISAPNLSFTGTFIWPIVTNTFGTITPQYDFTWNDDTPFDPNNGRGELTPFGESRFQNYLIGNRAYILHNARLSWQPPGESGVSLAGWCRNLEDRKFKQFAVDLSTFTGSQLIFVGEPRTCGFDARFNF